MKAIRNKKNKIKNLENLLNRDISDEMKLNIYREMAISYFKDENYRGSLYFLLNILNSNNNNDLLKNRTILDYCYAFKKLFITENHDKKKENYIGIKEKIKSLNQLIKRPLRREIYFEAYYLKNEIFYLLSPDIVMLNSNPLINESNHYYSLNNQYNILKELNNKINIHIRIDSKILNEENLKDALNKKGEILIIQSDDFIEKKNNCIICESEKGKGYKLYFEDLIKIIKNRIINYKIIILCFPKSYLLKEYFDDHHILYSNIIYFNYYIDFSRYDIMNKYNNICNQFIIDFIKNSVDNDKFDKIFELSETQFTKNINELKDDFKYKKNISLTIKNQNNSKIEYHREIDENKIYLYNPLPKIDNIDILDYNPKDYYLKIYELIEKINQENNAIFYCNKSVKSFYLKLSIETMKYFHRHKTYCELFYIDIQNGDKFLLKSIIRKLNSSMINENEKIENDDYEEDEDKEENYIKQKACFILINNCIQKDLLDINIYSILKAESSFIIIYDTDNTDYNDNDEIKGAVLIHQNIVAQKEKTLFFIRYGANELEIIDENFIKKNIKKIDSKEDKKYLENFKKYIINKRLEVFPNGNLNQYIKRIDPKKGYKDEFPFKENEAKLLFYKIVNEVKKLHDNDICHLDLNIENIMLDKNFNPILLNFGTAKKYNKNIDSSDFKINEYSPPELYSKDTPLDGFKIDIFNLGIVLFFLIFGEPPFTIPLNECKFYEYIKQRKFGEFWKSKLYEKKLHISEELKNLFINMVSPDPKERFSIDNILNSKLINEINKISLEKSKEFDYIENELYNNFNNKLKYMKNERDKIFFFEEEKKIESKDFKSKGSQEERFGGEMKPKIKNEDDIYNNIIKINNNIVPANLMNKLYYNLQKQFENKSAFELSNDKLKLIVMEEIEELEEVDILEYSIQLCENYIRKYYFLKINYLLGSVNKFYDRIELIKNYFKK